MRKKYLWKKAIQKSCNATEGIDSSFANYLIQCVVKPLALAMGI